jgi:serine protease 16
MVVVVEHRYVGNSQPTSDWTKQNMKFLTSEQALADLVAIQGHVNRTKSLSQKSKWFLCGGVYEGKLAAWAKLKFPGHFAGALASSAPIWLTENTYQYASKMEFGLRYYGGDKCVSNVRSALKEFHRLVSSTISTDVETFGKLFQPDTPLKNNWDHAYAEELMFGAFTYLSHANDWEGYKLKNFCDDLADVTPATRIGVLADLFTWNYQMGPDDVMDFDHQSMIDWASDTTIDRTDDGACRIWWYHQCSEHGHGLSSSAASNTVFGALKYFDNEYASTAFCKQAYNITDVSARVAAANNKYGGLKINVAKVIFTNGNMSPASSLSLVKKSQLVNPSSKIVTIEGASHCPEYWIDEADSQNVIKARKEIAGYVRDILKK